MPNVMQDWTQELGLRHQGVLLAAVRGCDTAPKDDPSKMLARCLRGVILNSFAAKPSSFIERVSDSALRERMKAFLSNCDHYPQHYVAHLMHAAEIVGYKHSDPFVRNAWSWFYFKLCNGLHVTCETATELDERLSAHEDEFAKAAAI